MQGARWILALLIAGSACLPRRAPAVAEFEHSLNGKWVLVAGERAGMSGLLVIEGRSGRLQPLDATREAISVTLVAEGPGWLVVPEGEVGDALRLAPVDLHEFLVFHPAQPAGLSLHRVGTLPVALQGNWILQRDRAQHLGFTRAETGELRLLVDGADAGLVVPIYSEGDGLDLAVLGPGGGMMRLAPAGDAWLAHIGGETATLHRPDRPPSWVSVSPSELAAEFGLGGPQATVSAPDLVHDADAMWRAAGDLSLQLASLPDSENVRAVGDLLDAIAAGIGDGGINPVRFVAFKSIFERTIEDGIVNDAERESLSVASPLEAPE